MLRKISVMTELTGPVEDVLLVQRVNSVSPESRLHKNARQDGSAQELEARIDLKTAQSVPQENSVRYMAWQMQTQTTPVSPAPDTSVQSGPSLSSPSRAQQELTTLAPSLTRLLTASPVQQATRAPSEQETSEARTSRFFANQVIIVLVA